MDNQEHPGVGENEPVSFDEYRQRQDIGLNNYLSDLNKSLNLRQRFQKRAVNKEVQRIIHDPHSVNIEEDALALAKKFKENKMRLLVLASFSQALVDSTFGEEKSAREKDVAAGKMLDNLASKFNEATQGDHRA